ncbi:TPA: AAA family ATPase [Candidatus Woesearchaeota archaeon]|nr:AAA family ATPase [Candidatus Woesearchaeota archaeon]HII64610.1 AAA family ATPase [Candidatus Woesearchaeota archaeon]HII65603.1 AAA family ATPase [Candidatus Woesearchaeota archaeon]HIJ18392.1 AAA family ATPase [Candidatus Woesearchaeota archaeon]
MIIGLTGKNAAGKGEAAKHLERKGFAYFSLSDELREEAAKKGLAHTREAMIALGNELRSTHGAGYLASTINRKIRELQKQGKDRFVVDSIRSAGEIKELQRNEDFVLVGIEANAELRFERMKKRGRQGDAGSFEEFARHEEKENTNNESGQQLNKCLSMAAIIIENNGTLEELYKKIERVARV